MRLAGVPPHRVRTAVIDLLLKQALEGSRVTVPRICLRRRDSGLACAAPCEPSGRFLNGSGGWRKYRTVSAAASSCQRTFAPAIGKELPLRLRRSDLLEHDTRRRRSKRRDTTSSPLCGEEPYGPPYRLDAFAWRPTYLLIIHRPRHPLHSNSLHQPQPGARSYFDTGLSAPRLQTQL